MRDGEDGLKDSKAADASKPGDLLAGKYRVDRVIGQGGMGIVYAAVHELLGQRVAVKLLLGANSAEASARFLNEARAAARIQHDNIARVMDVGTLDSGLPYMVLELLEGADLEQLLEREGKLEPALAVDYVLQALQALSQAHALGIIHRDLKPANLFLARKMDGSAQIKVLDFGISKSEDPMLSAAKTSTQAILGSPYYMSPEQLKSSRSVDRRADIWSVGVILYQLVTGTYPFDGESVGGLFASILEATPISPVVVRPDCPPGLAAVVLKCLLRDPALRYQTAPELAAALAPFASTRGMTMVEPMIPVVTGGMPMGADYAGSRTVAAWRRGSSESLPSTRVPAAWRGPAAVLAVLLAAGLGVGALFLRGRAGTDPQVNAMIDGAATSPEPRPAAEASVTPAAAPTLTGAMPSSMVAPVVSPQPMPSAETSAAAPRPSAHPPPVAPTRPVVKAPAYDPTKDSRK